MQSRKRRRKCRLMKRLGLGELWLVCYWLYALVKCIRPLWQFVLIWGTAKDDPEINRRFYQDTKIMARARKSPGLRLIALHLHEVWQEKVREERRGRNNYWC